MGIIMKNVGITILAVLGALVLLWLVFLGALATYDAIADNSTMENMWDSMGEMIDSMGGDMNEMMRGMMGGGDDGEATGFATGRGEVRIEDFRFEPSQFTVTVGTIAEWTNYDSAPHTATARDGSFDSGRLDKGDSFEMTFDAPGTLTYFCDIHPWMDARLIVQ